MPGRPAAGYVVLVILAVGRRACSATTGASPLTCVPLGLVWLVVLVVPPVVALVGLRAVRSALVTLVVCS